MGLGFAGLGASEARQVRQLELAWQPRFLIGKGLQKPTTVKNLIRILALVSGSVLCFAFLALEASAAEPEVSTHVATIKVPSGLSTSDVTSAVYGALLGREWLVKEKSDGKVVGYLKHRRNEAEVTFTFDNKSIDMSCWGYKISRSGEREEKELPKGWLKFLEKDLHKRLNQLSSQKL